MGKYYRIPADTRDLNYNQFFSEGTPGATAVDEYHSHNTERLSVEGMKQLLLKLPLLRKDLFKEADAIQYPD
jgi:UDP-N-acetylglucosamine 4,6-dehydratase